MRLLILCCVVLLTACSQDGKGNDLVQVKVVAHVPARVENKGEFWSEKVTFDHWVYEDTLTHLRYANTQKYGEVGEVFTLKRKHLQEF